jgi:type IV pilus assembly protein PilV
MRITFIHSQQHGFSLIEVLVSLVVIAVGLLGLIQLQTWSMKQNTEALIFTRASNIADDVFARMTVNPIATESGGYNVNFGENISMNTNCETQVCSTTNLALWDLDKLKNIVEDQFPSGDFKLELVVNIITFTLRYKHGRDTSITNNGEYEHIIFSSRI